MTSSQRKPGADLPRGRKEPAFSPVMARLMAELVKSETNFKDIADILGMDPVLSATVLTLVNSSFYALSEKATTLERAAVVLGSKEILKIALSVSFLRRQCDRFEKSGDGDHYPNWRLTVWSAVAAELFAERLCPGETDRAYLCALLKDLSLLSLWSEDPRGTLAVASACPFMCLAPRQAEAERVAWGTTHPELTQRILEEMGVPDLGGEAIVNHHDMDGLDGHFPLVQSVVLATRWAELVHVRDSDPLKLVRFESMLGARLGLDGPGAVEELRGQCLVRFQSMLRTLKMDEAPPDERLYLHSIRLMQNFAFQAMDVMQLRGGVESAAGVVGRHLRLNFNLDHWEMALRLPGQSGDWMLFRAEPGAEPFRANPAGPRSGLEFSFPGSGFQMRAMGVEWGEMRVPGDALDASGLSSLDMYLRFLGRGYETYCRGQAVLEKKARTLDSLPVGVARLDDAGRIMDLNSRLYQFLGLPSEPRGQDMAGLMAKALNFRFDSEWRAFLADKSREHISKIFCGPTPPGDTVPYRCYYLSAHRTDFSGQKKVLFLVEDVSEVSALELQAFRQGEFLETLVGGMRDAVLALDREGRIQYASPRLPRELVGVSLFKAAQPVHPENTPWGPDILETGPKPVEVRMKVGRSRFRRLELVFSRLADEGAMNAAHLVVGRDLTAVRRLEDRLKKQALYDGLTGLFNQHQFKDLLRRETQRGRRTERGLGLIFFDLDGFKAVNDAHGHQAGDEVLMAVAGILWKSVRKGTDFPCRYGGDEFAVVVTEVGDKALETLADRILAAVDRELGDAIGLSMGLAMLGDKEKSGELLRRADAAAYQAKAAGGNRRVWAEKTKE